jgi:ABC-type transport system involved in multi-copper enzyme maturation permease subunit
MILDKIRFIAYYTFKELFKSKILLNVFFVGLALMVTTYVATEFTYGVPERVALDFGLGMLSISSLAISLFLGVGLLSKEIESRTVYMIISRPVPRYAFILGKLLGLIGIQVINVMILSVMTMISVSLLGGDISSLLLWAILFIFLESVLLLLVVVLISLLTNNILSVLFSVILLLLGHAIKETQNISFVQGSNVLRGILDFYHFVLPAFHKLNLKDYVLYNTKLPLSFLLSGLAYGLLYSLALLMFIIFIFNRKNID